MIFSGVIPKSRLRLIFILSLSTPLVSFGSTILVWGDSLSAAYGMPTEQGWVALMQERVGEDWKIINGSVTGETTTGGLSRLPQALKTHQPDIFILGLGSNDGLRGQPLKLIKANLQKMIVEVRASGVAVLLLGNQIPPNYGAAYANGFAQIYTDLAGSEQTALVPFLLDGVATDLNLMQEDTLHPTSAAQRIVLNNVWPHLEPLLF